jgi:galactofuranose transport system permease protein
MSDRQRVALRAPAREPRTTRRDWASLTQKYGAGGALVLLFMFNVVATPNFLTVQNLLYVQGRQAAPIAIVALGMAVVIATEGFDLSVGSVMAIAGQVAVLALSFGTGPLIALILALAAGLVCGVFNGWLVASLSVQPIIATLILFIAGRGVAQLITDGKLVSVNDPVMQFLGLGAISMIPMQVVVLIVVAALLAFAVRSLPFGRFLVATGDNEQAALLAGVPVRKVKYIAYALCAVLAAAVGLMDIGRVSASDANNTGLGMELDAIAAVAVAGVPLTGGRISVVGTIVGAFLLKLLQNTLIARGIPREGAQMIQGVIIVGAIYIQRRAGSTR